MINIKPLKIHVKIKEITVRTVLRLSPRVVHFRSCLIKEITVRTVLRPTANIAGINPLS